MERRKNFLNYDRIVKGDIVVRRSRDRSLFFSLSLSPFILLIPRVFDGWISGNEMQLNTVDQIYPRLDNALNVKITSNVVLFRGYY